MKKLITLNFSLFFFLLASAQIPGTKIPGPIYIHDSIQVNNGSVITLGRGSDPRTGDFVFIYQPANALLGTPEKYYSHTYANTNLTVKFFKEFENRKTGKKQYTVVDMIGYNGLVEVEPAINAGEIVAIDGKSIVPIKIETPATVIIQNNISVADEITKLKKLLDDSVITREEFDKQKAKLLNNSK